MSAIEGKIKFPDDTVATLKQDEETGEWKWHHKNSTTENGLNTFAEVILISTRDSLQEEDYVNEYLKKGAELFNGKVIEPIKTKTNLKQVV